MRQKMDPLERPVVTGISRVSRMLARKMVTYVTTRKALEDTSL